MLPEFLPEQKSVSHGTIQVENCKQRTKSLSDLLEQEIRFGSKLGAVIVAD